MAIPILAEGGFLIATVQSELSDSDLRVLTDALVDQVGTKRCRGVVVDVTALDVMDSFATRMLRGLAGMLYLRGARTVIVGIQPQVAMSMVQLGLTMPMVETAIDLDDGLNVLRGEARRSGRAE